MTTHEYDAVVVGAGTAGCYAAATISMAGYDVAIVERKTEQEAGHIACGDALKGAANFPEAIPKSKLEPAITNTEVDHGRFEIPQEDTVLDIPVPGELAVVDRWEYGKCVIGGAKDRGVDFHYNVVVTDVLQEDDGTVTGVRGKHKGDVHQFDADIVVDGAGSLSVLQDNTNFDGTTFDTNVNYSQFCSGYREIVEVEEEVEWKDALVFKPTKRAAGYLWYFPRTGTEINAGLGFQMTEEPMHMIEDLKQDLRNRPEFAGATVKDKLGAALPTRRPYDSAVANGFIAVGDAAGLVNPTTGGGIAGAAYSGKYAGEQAVTAIEEGDVSEENLWRYNERVMDHFGARYAGLDVYNILSTAVDVDNLMGLLASLPMGKLSEAIYAGSAELSLGVKVQTAIKSFGNWGTIYNLYQTKNQADRLLDHYQTYPDSPHELDTWQDRRDDIMTDVYEVTGADPKY